MHFELNELLSTVPGVGTVEWLLAANDAQIALADDFPAVLLLCPSQFLQHLSTAVELAFASDHIRFAEVHAPRPCAGIDD